MLTEPDYSLWDDLVQQSHQGTIFHSSAWITTISQLKKVDFRIIGVFRNSELIGGCTFYIKNLFPGYKIGFTNDEVTPYGGCVISNPPSVHIRHSEIHEHEILSLILKKIQDLNLARITLINGPGLTDIRSFTSQGWRERVYYTYIISLDENLFSNMSYGARRSIRKAQKLGITIKKEFNPDFFWDLAVATFAKQEMNVPFKKDLVFSFVEMLIQNKLADMWIASTPSGEAISAMIYIYDAHMAHGWLGVNNPLFKDTGVVSFILFETLQDLQNRGFHRFNVMAANTPRFAQFYSSFDPQLVPYFGAIKANGLGKITSMFR
jgi:hypothetical protein